MKNDMRNEASKDAEVLKLRSDMANTTGLQAHASGGGGANANMNMNMNMNMNSNMNAMGMAPMGMGMNPMGMPMGAGGIMKNGITFHPKYQPCVVCG